MPAAQCPQSAILPKAASLTDAEVSGYAAQMVAAQDKQAKILGASSKYGQRMAKLTSGLQSFDGLKLDFKVYDSNQINAFACPNRASLLQRSDGWG